MATIEDPRVAVEEKMNAAEAALVAYVESKRSDPALRERLIEDVNRAITDYLGRKLEM